MAKAGTNISKVIYLTINYVEQYRAQYRPLGYSIDAGLQLDFLWLINPSVGLTVQTVFSSPHCVHTLQQLLYENLTGGSVKSLPEIKTDNNFISCKVMTKKATVVLG